MWQVETIPYEPQPPADRSYSTGRPLSLVGGRRATLSAHADEPVNGVNFRGVTAAPACECRVRTALPGRVGAAPAGAHGVWRGAPVQIRFRAQARRRGRAIRAEFRPRRGDVRDVRRSAGRAGRDDL